MKKGGSILFQVILLLVIFLIFGGNILDLIVLIFELIKFVVWNITIGTIFFW